MKIMRKDGNIHVEAPYNPGFVSKVKTIGGRWNGERWVVSEANEAELKNLCLEAYGCYGDEGPAEMVTIIMDLDKMHEADSYIFTRRQLFLGDTLIASRSSRDSAVYLNWTDAAIIEGGFDSSGGSRANPRLDTPQAGTKIRVNNFPKIVFDRMPEDKKIGLQVIGTAISESALKAEKEELLKRIAEIDELLKAK